MTELEQNVKENIYVQRGKSRQLSTIIKNPTNVLVHNSLIYIIITKQRQQ